ncbi:MAG: hypothetical protein ACRD5M_04805 [Candidatus Acidiferrales bacterium]
MKRVLILAGGLLMATSAHAQIGGSINSGGGMNSVSGITSYRIASMRCDSGSDPRSSVVTAAKNDGPFEPTTFATYEQAIEIGQIAANAAPPRLGEIARQTREHRKNATQPPVLVAEQDQFGRMVVKTQTP